MVFLDRVTDDEFFSSLEQGIKKTASFEKNLQDSQTQKLAGHLSYAAICLAQAGLQKEAQMVVALKDVCADEATEGLTPERMLANLEEKGWVFNADDEDAHDADDCKADDCNMCEGSPGLSPDELKKVRDMLKGKDSGEAMDDDAMKGMKAMFDDMKPEDRKELLAELNQKYK